MNTDSAASGSHGDERAAETRNLLTVEQAADYLQVSMSSIRSYVRQATRKP